MKLKGYSNQWGKEPWGALPGGQQVKGLGKRSKSPSSAPSTWRPGVPGGDAFTRAPPPTESGKAWSKKQSAGIRKALKKRSSKAQLGGGRWVTMNGEHVFIGGK